MEPAYPFWLILYTYAVIHGGGPIPDDFHDKVPGGWEAVKEVVIQKGWVTKEEKGYFALSRAVEICEEVGDAPEVYALHYCPTWQTLGQQIQFAEKHLEHLKMVQSLEFDHMKWQWDPWIEEATTLKDGYQALYDAQVNLLFHATEPWRAMAHLKKAKEVFGEEAIQTGILPPPVPVHRFKFVDNP